MWEREELTTYIHSKYFPLCQKKHAYHGLIMLSHWLQNHLPFCQQFQVMKKKNVFSMNENTVKPC